MERFAPNDVAIAPADPLAPESLRLAAALWAELSTIYPEQTAPPFPPRDIVGARAVFVVASSGGEVIGCGAVRPLPDGRADVAEIKRMYVAPEARGRGIAAAILTELENWARLRGYERVQLETGGRQPVAIRLYERFGYSRIPCYAHHASDPLAVCFAKPLV
jgi:putative acetyltransferase